MRPRRFGKGLLLSMLKNYYDVAKKDEFDVLLEFKFVILKDAWLDGEQPRGLSEAALREFAHQTVRRFVVATLGLERICFEAVGN